jgi:hypothetical protein
MSNDPRDKLLAALNWAHGMFRNGSEHQKAPMYFMACLEWYEKLSEDDQETCRTLADVVGSAHKDAADGMAASLLPAPRCTP